MSTAPVAPTPKTSWLKKFGQDIVKVLGFANSVEKAIEAPLEIALPASIPVFAIADEIFNIVGSVEAGAAAASAPGLTAAQKLEAAVPDATQALAAYIAYKFPGYKKLPTTATTQLWVNAMVALLNEVDPGQAAAKTAPNATTTAAIVRAATSKSS